MFRLRAVALALCLSLGLPAPGIAEPPPIRFTHMLNARPADLPIPMELYMTPLSNDLIDVKVAANLKALQAVLPTVLSRVVEDRCQQRVGVEVEQVQSEGDLLRLTGRVQVLRFRCRDPENYETRRRIFENITDFEVLVHGRITDNCLKAELQDLTIYPSGFVGGVLNITGLSRRIAARVRASINSSLLEDLPCLTLPRVLRTIDTRIASGGFRDFGDGRMGAVVKATIDVRARNVVDLLTLLAKDGELER